jgi:uncharacterized protein (DUF1697 family)
MNVYVVLFRGVGGATKLPTQPLKEALTAAGFRHVLTYIVTGNVVLASDLDAEGVRGKVAAIAKESLGFTKEIVVLSRKEWSDIVKRNPFPDAVREPRTLHVFASADTLSKAAADALARKAGPSEAIAVRGRVLYFHSPDGFGVSRLPGLIEKAFAGRTTARNWNTVLKLDELAEGVEKLRTRGGFH